MDQEITYVFDPSAKRVEDGQVCPYSKRRNNLLFLFSSQGAVNFQKFVEIRLNAPDPRDGPLVNNSRGVHYVAGEQQQGV